MKIALIKKADGENWFALIPPIITDVEGYLKETKKMDSGDRFIYGITIDPPKNPDSRFTRFVLHHADDADPTFQVLCQALFKIGHHEGRNSFTKDALKLGLEQFPKRRKK